MSRNADGTITVTAVPSDLPSAYSTFSVAMANRISQDGVYLASRDEATGQVRARPANLSAIPFVCHTSGGWNIYATADFTHTYVLATLDIREPAIDFQFTTRPTFTLGVSFQGSATCTLRNADALQITVPVAAPLTLTIKPQFELDASGSFHAQATWTPRLTVGFDRAPGLSDNVVAFGSGLSFDSGGQADADLEAYLSVELGLGGRVGVTGTVGPHLHAHLTESSHNAQLTACATVNAWLHADLTANADVFIRHWSWTLYSGDFYNTTLYNHCASTAGGGNGSGGGSSGSGSGSGTSNPGGGNSGGSNGSGTGTGGTPPPSGASIGASQGGPYGCSSCYALNIQVHNFPTGTYTYYCHDNSGPGGSDTIFYSHAVAVTDPNQGTWPGVFCDDNSPYTAYLVMDGVRSNSVSFSAPAPPPPAPSASISASKGGHYGCSNCYALNVQVHNFPTGTYTYYCHDNSGPGGSDTIFYSHAVAVTDPNQGTWPGVFCDDNSPYNAYVVIDGIGSNHVQF